MHETIEGETIMINCVTGNYYSLDPVGSAIWCGIEANVSADQIVAYVAARYEGPLDEIETDVGAFLAQLEQEELVVRGEATAGEAAVGQLPGVPLETATTPFRRPRLERHTDMQDLILLDPVHEVDPERGWPHAEQPAA